MVFHVMAHVLPVRLVLLALDRCRLLASPESACSRLDVVLTAAE